MLHDIIFRLRALFRHRQAEDDMQDELQYHLERESEKYIRAGQSPEEAARKARVALGGPEQVGQRCREARGTRLVEDLIQDLRHSTLLSPGILVSASSSSSPWHWGSGRAPLSLV